jgi:Ras family
LEELRQVSTAEGDKKAKEVGADLFFETSSKTGFNVNEVGT